MPDSTYGPGSSPSAWNKRAPAVILALTGCAIAACLGLFQAGVLTQLWEPFFGNGSRFILKESAVSRALPIPDAVLGAFVYLAEAIAELVGGRLRWRTLPAAVLIAGALAAGLGLAAVVLVGLQAFWFHTYCTLCLLSALCSLVIAGLVWPEVRATWRRKE